MTQAISSILSLLGGLSGNQFSSFGSTQAYNPEQSIFNQENYSQYPQMNYGFEQPGYDFEQPAYGSEQSGYGFEQPGLEYGQPELGYGQSGMSDLGFGGLGMGSSNPMMQILQMLMGGGLSGLGSGIFIIWLIRMGQ